MQCPLSSAIPLINKRNRGSLVANPLTYDHQTGELHYMRLRHSDDTLLEGFVSCKSPTVTDVEGAGGTARPGRGAGRKWRAKAGGSGGPAGAK